MWSDAGIRYKTPVADIFSASIKLRIQLFIEAKLALAQSQIGIITEEEAKAIEKACTKVDLSRVQAIEQEIHHDLMAVVKALAEQAGEAGEKVHLGATSNDIQDTTLAIQMTLVKEMLLERLNTVSQRLYELASKYKDQPCIGRTHGQFAVPTTVGFKFANFLYELHLAKEQLRLAPTHLSKFSGAVGNYASSMRMDVEATLFKILGIEPVSISTQVVSRVVHSQFLHGIALCASVIERISKEIRNLQRSEIGEWMEPFSATQVGSSAMPHKRNPHKSERISGLSRIIRQNVAVALENIALEHERDITHSSVERIIIPESANLLYYIADQMEKILKGLKIHIQGIEKNLEKASGVSKSEQILKALVPHVGRQKGHEMLRKHIFSDDFKASILADSQIRELVGADTLQSIFDEVNTGLAGVKTEQVLNEYETNWSKVQIDIPLHQELQALI